MAWLSIRLRGVSSGVDGRVWVFTSGFRVGRVATLEMPLDDESVSRHHAEVFPISGCWRVRDLGSTNGTFISEVRWPQYPGWAPQHVKSTEWQDIPPDGFLQFGNVMVATELLDRIPLDMNEIHSQHEHDYWWGEGIPAVQDSQGRLTFPYLEGFCSLCNLIERLHDLVAGISYDE